MDAFNLLDFDKLSFKNYPKIWTEKKGAKIDKLYKVYIEKPIIFQKILNKLIRDDLINNVYLLTQHLQQLNEKVEHGLENIIEYRDLVNDVLLEDSYWNSIKQNFPSLNLEMIKEFWNYFNKNENELKVYFRKILSYPGNYNTLVKYRDYMKNYQVFFLLKTIIKLIRKRMKK
jgi:hypothetical protein